MGFSIEQFKGRFKNDFAKSALFEVFFSTFPDLRFQAVSAVLPGSSIGTDVFSNGPFRPVERPVTRGYTSSPFTFLLDNEGRCLSALNVMIDSVVDPSGFVGYPGEYQSGCTVTQYTQSGGPVVKYTLNECYVQSIGDVQLDWSNGDQVATVTCAMSYRSYSMSAFGGGASNTVRPIYRTGEVDFVNNPIPIEDAGVSIQEDKQFNGTGPQEN